MSLVPPGAPLSTPARPQDRRMQRTSYISIFLHFLLCLLAAFGGAYYMKATFLSKLRIPAFKAESSIILHHKSPLQERLSWLEASFDDLSEVDRLILSEIECKSTLEIKFLAVPETVFSLGERDNFQAYVENQLNSAQDVISPQQAEAVTKLIKSGVAQGSIIKREMGDRGSLRNSILLAVMKEHENNIYFTMAAVSVEPHLGWRLIRNQERNVWNSVLNRVADAKLKGETTKLLGAYEPTSSKLIQRLNEVPQPTTESSSLP